MSRSAKSAQSQEGAARRGWPRQAAETALGEAGNVFARVGFTDATLLLRWADIAGPQIARIARPMRWQDGPEGAILTLKCEAGAIVFLQHQTRELIERLNAYLGRGRIARLKLVTGQLTQGAEPPNYPAPLSEPPLPDAPGGKPALSEALARLAGERARQGARRANRPIKRAD